LVVASADLLAMIVRSARDAVVAEAPDGTVLVWNRAAEELYGYSAAEMIGQPAARLRLPGRRAEEATGAAEAEFVADRVRRDGTTVRVHVRAAPILDGAGVTVGVATTSWPALRGHELRTPLNAVIGFTGTLLMRLPGPLTDEQEHQLRLVQASAEQLLARINRMT
jgi:protein-histidine pros-kinase